MIMTFEDLESWQKARQTVRKIYQITRTEELCRDFGVCGQVQRAGVSVMSNIAEGFESNTAAEFHRYLGIARSSCAELRSQL